METLLTLSLVLHRGPQFRRPADAAQPMSPNSSLDGTVKPIVARPSTPTFLGDHIDHDILFRNGRENAMADTLAGRERLKLDAGPHLDDGPLRTRPTSCIQSASGTIHVPSASLIEFADLERHVELLGETRCSASA